MRTSKLLYLFLRSKFAPIAALGWSVGSRVCALRRHVIVHMLWRQANGRCKLTMILPSSEFSESSC
eukprot:2908071-Amphidinium_carterae.1